MIAWKALALSFVMVAAGTTSSMALTGSNDLPLTSTVGYSTTSISGAVGSSIVYTLDAPGTTITSASITFTGDLRTGKSVKAGFGSADLTTCTAPGALTGGNSVFTCSGYSQDSAASSAFHVAVTNS
jgi:hypothetical protein